MHHRMMDLRTCFLVTEIADPKCRNNSSWRDDAIILSHGTVLSCSDSDTSTYFLEYAIYAPIRYHHTTYLLPRQRTSQTLNCYAAFVPGRRWKVGIHYYINTTIYIYDYNNTNVFIIIIDYKCRRSTMYYLLYIAVIKRTLQ